MGDAPLQSALVALDLAIQTEKDGREFYMRAAERSSDGGGKVLLISLADDELEHLRLLESQREALATEGQWLPPSKLDEQTAPEKAEGVPLFSPERLAENVSAYTSDLSALRMAFLIEKDAVAFYTRAAAETEDRDGKEMYERLAEMETEHQRILEEEYNALAKEFWGKMGFEPF
ncbi:MAG: ferritin family protein [Anaerolineae bacterium]